MLIHYTQATQSKWVSFGQCVVRKIYGFNANADSYLQFFQKQPDSATSSVSGQVIANGAVPDAGVFLLQGTNEFVYDLGVEGVTLSRLCWAISSTAATLTQVGAATGADFILDIDGPRLVPNFPTLTMVGDLTTDTFPTFQVWSEASGPHTLLLVDMNNTGVAQVFKAYALDSPTPGTNLAIFQHTAPVGLSFWDSGAGLIPLEKTPADQVLHGGLTILPAGHNLAMRALYI